jgi:uncharacterized membrane protein YoaK (UPF0700 family)
LGEEIMPSAARVEEKSGLAILLALVGGFVDGLGYLVLVKMFTSHMSGNSIATGVRFGEGDWGQAFHRFFPIPMFVLGVAVGAATNEALARRGVRSTFAAAFALEAFLLLVFLLAGRDVYHDGVLRPLAEWQFYLLAALPALAMGVQNATLRKTGKHGVRTTYITGMLTNLTEDVVRSLFWVYDRARHRHPPLSGQEPSAVRMLSLLGIWIGYVGGAALGALGRDRFGLGALALPLAGLVFLIGFDLVRPLATPQERGGPGAQQM